MDALTSRTASVDDAAASAGMRKQLRDRDQRERLLEIIQNREIWTAFQPIVELETGEVMGWEGLSRGPRGSDIELPLALFGLSGRHGVTEELERACRRQAFVDWKALGRDGRLFINTVPATVRDTSFLGRGVLDYLGSDLSPREVTLEITERSVIDNLNLYREAMHEFTDLDQLRRTVVRESESGRVRVEDVATVRRGHRDRGDDALRTGL